MTPPIEDAALALQGGGAHGAFTWGAVDALLKAGWRFRHIVGVSSGALTGAAAMQGLNRAGIAGARAEMRRLWSDIASANALTLLESNPFQTLLWGFDIGAAAWQGAETAMRLFDPNQLNPFGLQPLRSVVERLIEPSRLAGPQDTTLTISATDALTGEPRHFTGAAIDADALLASCCLPYLVPAVKIDGRDYWDGAFSGNPPLAPLLSGAPPPWLVLVAAQPRRRLQLPQGQVEIMNRLAEIGSQATVEAELRALAGTTRIVRVEDDASLGALPLSSKVFADRAIIERLFAAGRAAATRMMGHE